MKKIAIIGASYLQLPLVLKAKKMGVETHCFAWEEGAVCKDFADFFYPISVLDKEKIEEKCLDLKINGITTIATDMAVPTVCYVAEKMGLTSNSYESSQLSTNKVLMRKRFKACGVNVPKFLELNSFTGEQLIDFHFPVVVKPIDRSGSRGINKVDRMEEVERAITLACTESFSNKAIIEEYIDGWEVSVESVSWKGKHHILAITDKITTGAPNFVELAHHQPSKLSEEIIQLLSKETIKALDSLDIQFGAGHSEFKITGEGQIFCIEIGARMGGDFIGSHLVELSTGIDFLKLTLNIALGESPDLSLQKSKNNFSGIFFLSKETEHILPYFVNPNSFDVEKNIQSSQLREVKNSNDRSGYLVYKSNNPVNIL